MCNGSTGKGGDEDMRTGTWLIVASVAIASCGLRRAEPEAPGTEPIEPRVVATVDVGHIVYAVSAGAGGVWTANYEDGTVSLLDPGRNRVVRTVDVAGALGSPSFDVHATEDAIWLAAERAVGNLDPHDLTVATAARVPPSSIVDMAVTDSYVWVSRPGGERERGSRAAFGVEIRAVNAMVPRPDKYGLYSDVAAGDAGVWALAESDGTLAAIALPEGEPGIVSDGEPLFRGGQAELAVAHRSVWVETSDGARSRLTRYDPTTAQTESITFDGGAGVLAAGADAVWVLTHEDDRGLLWSVDPDTLSLEGPLVLEGNFRSSDIAYGFGSVWITHDTNLLSRVAVTVEGTRGGSVLPPEQRGSGAVCDSPSAWVWCPQARWLRRVVIEAGFEVTGDTGTSLRVRVGPLDLNAWNTDAAHPVKTIAESQGYKPRGTSPAYTDGKRVVWETQGLHVYLSSSAQGGVGELSDQDLRSLVEASYRVPMEADLTGAKPQPRPTGEKRFEILDDGRLRVWPNTEDVQNEGKYLFDAPHCGLDWMVDFDGSFWKAIKPADYGTGEKYPFFYNSDRGVITFTGDDTAVYQASTGEEIQLRRLLGPVITFPCD